MAEPSADSVCIYHVEFSPQLLLSAKFKSSAVMEILRKTYLLSCSKKSIVL